MPHRLRKVRKQRGSRTHGWGRVGQHRGGGMRGGHGKAGRHKHKWTYVLKHDRDYFGKHGFHRPQAEKPTTMNVGELDADIETLLANGAAKKVKEKININLQKLGVEKLLGSGKVTHQLFVRVKLYSRTALRKIEQAGGELQPLTTKIVK